MEQDGKNYSVLTTNIVREIDSGLVLSQSENHIKAEGQDSNVTLSQRNGKFAVSISPEIRLANLDLVTDIEGRQFTEPCEKQATLKEQKLARALRYALSIIASYESNIEHNLVNLPIGFCRGQVFYSARVDILQIAGIKADSDLYNLDDMNF